MMDVLDEFAQVREEVDFGAERAQRVRQRLAAEFAGAPRRARIVWPYWTAGAGLVAAAAVTAVVIAGQSAAVMTPPVAVATPTPSAEPTPTPSATPSPTLAPPTVDTVLAWAAASALSHEIADGQHRRVAVVQKSFHRYFAKSDGTLTEYGDDSDDVTGYGGREGYAGWKRTSDFEARVGPLGGLPRDPAALLETIRAHSHDDESASWQVLRALETNAMPADLQAALFGAAQLVPERSCSRSTMASR